MSRRLLALAAALVATALVVGLGVGLGLGSGSGSGPDDGATPPRTPATVPSVALEDYDTTTVAVARAEFCQAVPPEAVERALGAAPTREVAYGDGQPARVVPGVRDVAHEFGCVWASGTTTARAWVFAPPVTPAEAEDLARAARRAEGCAPPPGAPAFGTGSVGLVCETGEGSDAGVVASFRGLFGDAWLACSVAGPLDRAASAGQPLDRAGRWCVAVAQAASSR